MTDEEKVLKEYIFTYSVAVEADSLEEAKEEFAEIWQNSKDMLDWKRHETEVDLFHIQAVEDGVHVEEK